MNTSPDIATLVEIGDSLLARGDLEGSLKAYDGALLMDASSLPGLLGSAIAFSQLGEAERAYAYIDLAARVAPGSPAVWRTATSVALAAGDGPAAANAARRRLELDGETVDGLMDLALAAFFALDLPTARAASSGAARRDPSSDAARFWAGRLAAISSEHQLLVEVGRAHCRRGRYLQGLRLFDRALGAGESYAAHLYAGRALLEIGQPEAASSEFERALKMSPGDPAALADLGTAALALKRPAPVQDTGAGAQQAASGPPAAPQNFCTHCGTRLLDGARFCVSCGAMAQ